MAKKKKFWDRKGPKFIKSLIGNGLQTSPVIGTIITAFKENTEGNPAGKIKLSGWHWYRLAIGAGLAYLVYKGVDLEAVWAEIKPILEFLGIQG